MFSKKGADVVLLDLKKITSTADYFIVCSADSTTQEKAIADNIRDGLEDMNIPIYHFEGYHALSWIVLDYVDVVAHVFYKESRSFYNLERLWADAKRTEMHDDEEIIPVPRKKLPLKIKKNR